MASFLDERESKSTFEDKISKLSENTKISIESAIRSFDRFCEDHYKHSSIEVLQELKIFKGDDIHDKTRTVIQNWIDWQYSQGNLTSSIKQNVSRVKKLLRHNGIKVHFEDFTDPLEYTSEIEEELHELTLEEIQKIFTVAKPQKIGFYLALISTGARPAELLQVRKKDIELGGKRVKIRIEAENTKTRSGRSVWLTKEATKYLMIRLRGLQDNDLVWGTHEKSHYAENNEGVIFSRYVDKVGLGDKYRSNGYRKITLYSFRSYFFGKAADVHREGYAHKMTGHGGYLPQYDRMNEGKKLDWFLKLEPELIIDSTERQELKILEQEKKIDELNQKDTVIADLTKRVSANERMLKTVLDRLNSD